MCSNYQGDLADIVRAIGGGSGGEGSSGFSSGEAPVADWQFPANPMSYSAAVEEPVDDFGDPFSNLRDPLLHQLDLPGSPFFNSSNNSTQIMKTGFGGGGGGGLCGGGKLSRMLQISPNDKLPCESSVVAVPSPTGIKDSPVLLVPNDVISCNNTSKNCLVENSALQISSPRSTGIKRRKSQAKKVVCIPAPASANSRPSSGEVVPSDLWAWRKYGQKPIKGSPYPRGYYRCSSSKGCSARKQVERSRTDPNMLVITYTSEHNHPWPTQRNALAGSTRSQPSKTSNSKTTSSSSSPAADHKSHNSQKETSTNNLKEEQKETTASTDHHHHHYLSSPHVKEEMQDLDKQVGFDDCELISDGFNNILPQSNLYRPELPDSNNVHSEDFFADLGELEADPLTLLFTQGFSGGGEEENIRQTNKALLDPFSTLFDWTVNSSSSNTTTNTSFGEASKRGL